MGGGTTLQAVSGGARALLAGRRGGGAGGDELRVLRRHARHGLGQHLPDRAVPLLRRGRGRGDRRAAWAASAPAAEAMLASPATAPLLTRERILAAATSSATPSSPFRHRLPAHHDLLPHRAEDVPVQEDGDPLPAVHRGHLAALRVPGRDGESRHGRAADHAPSMEARRTLATQGADADAGERDALRDEDGGRRRAAAACSTATRRSGWPDCSARGSWPRSWPAIRRSWPSPPCSPRTCSTHYGGKERFGEARAGADGPRLRRRA